VYKEGSGKKKEGSDCIGIEDEDEIGHSLCHGLFAQYD